MRKSPLVIAMALSLWGTLSHGNSFDDALKETAKNKLDSFKIDPDEVSKFDMDATAAKRSAITGRLHEDDQLKELRKLLIEAEKVKRKERVVAKEVPLDPSEITSLRKLLSEVEKAENEPIHGETTFKIRNITYNPDSSEPLAISLSPGYSAQVEFYDSSGQPWPIKKDGVIGDGDSFDRKIMGENRHISSFVLKRNYRQSNAAVVLEGLPASIPVLLKGNNKVVDGRVTVTLPLLGPGATVMPVFQHELENVSKELIQLQGGNPPPGSRTLRVNGIPGAESWYDGQFMFLALPGRLLLPPPIDSSVSPTGRFLYKTAPSPYITITLNGERKAASIEGVYQTEIRKARSVFDKE